MCAHTAQLRCRHATNPVSALVRHQSSQPEYKVHLRLGSNSSPLQIFLTLLLGLASTAACTAYRGLVESAYFFAAETCSLLFQYLPAPDHPCQCCGPVTGVLLKSAHGHFLPPVGGIYVQSIICTAGCLGSEYIYESMWLG